MALSLDDANRVIQGALAKAGELDVKVSVVSTPVEFQSSVAE